MCRYAMVKYKEHYACFECQKTFKRKLLSDVKEGISMHETENPAKCPECGDWMASMGKDFKSPKKTDSKAWKHLKSLYTVGITFHSCGCSGPGKAPINTEDTITHFQKTKSCYEEHRAFWLNRKQIPQTQSEKDKEKSKKGYFLFATPLEVREGNKGNVDYNNHKAQLYWAQKIADIESKIDFLKKINSTR
ncbi:MAG: hypothetical protein ACPG6V_08720 [Flavobacteriales bacterium]